MKKNPPPNRKKAKLRRGSAARRPSRKAAVKKSNRPQARTSISHEVRTISENTATLHRTAGKAHQRIDHLHHSIRAAHQSAEEIHQQVGQSGASTRGVETAEIITEEKPRRNGKPFPVVGIGASAGGYEAFCEFLTHLPKDTGMAFVLVQHLDPKHKSQLTQLLGHTSTVPVLEAENQMEVEPNHVYVIPENTYMTITDGRLRLSPRNEFESPPMPIDVFFRSLAEDQQNHAIAIVLSGTGTD